MLTSKSTYRRTGAFIVAEVLATFLGYLLDAGDSGLALYRPVTGVIVLWALALRTPREFFAFVVATLVCLNSVPLMTEFHVSPEAFLLSVANLSVGLVTRWASLALVPVGRRLGLGARYESSTVALPARQVIRRMTLPYDVFRLVTSAFIGTSVSWGIAAIALSLDGSPPTFVEGGMWVIRNVATILMIAGTGLVLRSRSRDLSSPSVFDPLFAFGLTTVLAVTAYLMSPFIPLVLVVLLPLFWSGVRCSPAVAVGHALYTVGVISVPGWVSEGVALGSDFDPIAWSMQSHQVMIVAYLISLVVATAVHEFIRLNDDLTDVAATAQRRAMELRTVNRTIPDALVTVDRDGVATPLNATGELFVNTGSDGLSRLVGPRGSRLTEGGPGDTPSARALQGQTVRDFRFVHVRRSGAEREFELTAAPLLTEADDKPDRALLLIRDVTEHQRVLRELELLAESDSLTGLLNRRRFDRELAHHHEMHRKDRRGGGVLALDLDGFKAINDTFGHAEGDNVLKAIARILTATTGPNDLVTRLGGDEFAILIPGADRDHVLAVAETILEQIRDYARSLEGAGRGLSASIGGVTFEAADEEGAAPLVLADKVMYDVKRSGRDDFLIVGACKSPGDHKRNPAEWKDRVERALESDELVLHLQPIIDAKTHAVVGAEVLVRLIDDGVLVPPSEFVPVAERAGIAVSLDRWVVRESIAMTARLRQIDPRFSIWINISAQSIGSEALERVLHASLDAHGVPASAVVLELTETAQIEDVSAARLQAQRLRASGIRLAIDDFGTGFGSFVYLKHLLFDYVKIDGEFITNMATSETDFAIVRSIIGLAGQLKMEVVAEYVETDAVLHAVQEEGAQFAQGFGIGRPCPEGQFVAQHLERADARR